jgi:YgiT-type zinc finger domain-containing protein
MGGGFPKEKAMKCIVCKQAETNPGTTTVTLERRGATFVFKDVPAQICPNCGEDYLDDTVTNSLLKSADAMAASGAQVDIRRYAETV